MPTNIKNEFVYLPKSKIKAGEGIKDGLYPFFTSSDTQVLSRNAYEFDGEIVILGTGGKASCNYVNGKFSYSTDNYALKSKGRIIPKFLYYYLRHNNLQVLENGFHGAGLKHISKDYISNIELPALSLDDQKRIILCFDLIDSSLKKEKELLIKYDELIKSRFIEMFGDPVYNSYNLPELTLPELGDFGRGVSKHRPRNDPKLLGGKYPLIQTGEVANCDLYIKNYTSTYSEFGLQQSKLWNKGTLCITIAANIAKTGILTFDACFPDSIVGFTANEKSNNLFIHYWFTFLRAILEEQAPAAAQKNINLKILSELKVIIPPIELQNEFANFVKQIDKLRFISQKRIAYLEELLNKEMDEAFN